MRFFSTRMDLSHDDLCKLITTHYKILSARNVIQYLAGYYHTLGGIEVDENGQTTAYLEYREGMRELCESLQQRIDSDEYEYWDGSLTYEWVEGIYRVHLTFLDACLAESFLIDFLNDNIIDWINS